MTAPAAILTPPTPQVLTSPKPRAVKRTSRYRIRVRYEDYAHFITPEDWAKAGPYGGREVGWLRHPWKAWPTGVVRGYVLAARPRCLGSRDLMYLVDFGNAVDLGRYLWINDWCLYDARAIDRATERHTPARANGRRARRPDYNLWRPLEWAIW